MRINGQLYNDAANTCHVGSPLGQGSSFGVPLDLASIPKSLPARTPCTLKLAVCLSVIFALTLPIT